MAKLYIRWFDRVTRESGGHLIAAGDEGGATQDETVAISASSAQSGVAPEWAKFVEIHSDVICHYAVGENPTATTTNMRMPADLTLFKGVKGNRKIAVIEGV